MKKTLKLITFSLLLSTLFSVSSISANKIPNSWSKYWVNSHQVITKKDVSVQKIHPRIPQSNSKVTKNIKIKKGTKLTVWGAGASYTWIVQNKTNLKPNKNVIYNIATPSTKWMEIVK
ncbi:hypothetical protein GSH19_00070 [Lactobacillus sp. S2-2]|uniref:hypothetical protein n=1 Tax=Lactobacillus sp. S2-2 TaxID=2692917 RepID=UPI001F44516D|nr:hypothetical protein [Lactobacillus sp. S2-2]MCF6514581.1 hypothetical protein [Lactobacillus sp. S2-2]